MEEKIKELCDECLNCKNPTCILGCPANNNIPKFIMLCKEKKYNEAYEEINKTSTLSSICSLVCPYEKQCMGHCIKNKINKPVNIPLIEQFISSKVILEKKIILKNSQKIALIGSGPASLACAEILVLKGYNVDIYDKYFEAGGILTYGIPDFVLKKDIIKNKIDYLKLLGIHFIFNKELAKDIFLNNLRKQYDAVFLGFGAGISKKMDIKNHDLKNIVGANEFLQNIYEKKFNLYKDVKKIIVIGGGNTAIDAARVAKLKLDCPVTILYRRSQKEMPARNDEIIKAQTDNIDFMFLTNPIEYLGNTKVESVKCIKMKLIESQNQRARPVEIENSEFTIKADLVIEAISSSVDSKLTSDLKCNSWGGIIVDENMQTNIDGVFAGGDCVNGPSLVVIAMNDGIKAAKGIDKYLKKCDK